MQQSTLGDNRSERAERLLESVQIKLAVQPIERPKHVLQFFEVKYKNIGGSQLEGTCMFCDRVVRSTGATRLIEHLAHCSMCAPPVKCAVEELLGKASQKRKAKLEQEDQVQKEATLLMEATKRQKAELKQQGIRSGFKSAEADMADHTIAQFIYANGLPFSIADTSPDS